MQEAWQRQKSKGETNSNGRWGHNGHIFHGPYDKDVKCDRENSCRIGQTFECTLPEHFALYDDHKEGTNFPYQKNKDLKMTANIHVEHV